MAYFADHYSEIRYPLENDHRPGLRKAQVGAVHAIASHFTLRSDPAVIVMPTGSGKTSVLAISPFILRAQRVLVVTPSRLVRGQVAQEFTDLAQIKRLGVLPEECPPPAIYEAEGRVRDPDGWEALAEFDVVVGTPFSVSPAIESIPPPPPDFFDLILVDEAHHSAARVWNELLNSFPNAMRILFTATPFRRDAKEIKGRFVYSYPVAEAFKDGIFGEIAYLPVSPGENESADVSVAKAAQKTLQEDKAAGFRHALMVRTDSKKRAGELEEVYKANTSLRLRAVHSGHSFSHIRNTINAMRRSELDGVICVDMMGEGFDFPELKIAAVHSPHKSLAVTLQFIGRFARTNAEGIGAAKFLAIPTDIEIEANRIYSEQAVWQKIVPNLLQTKIDKEVRIQTALNTFERVEQDSEGEEFEIEDLSLYALKPFHHVKVYRVNGAVDFAKDLQLVQPEIALRELSDDLNALVLVLKSTSRPDWTQLAAFSAVEYELLVIYYQETTGLLFLCSSLREEWLYEHLATAVVEGSFAPLSPDRIYRALEGLSEFEFFNVGMRNRALLSNSESYRIIAGSSAQRAITRSDGQLYQRGHSYGRAWDGEQYVTLGLSTASKLWSNRWSRLPELIDWCDDLGGRINGTHAVITRSELDFLQTGREVETFPEGPIAATWALTAFTRPLLVFYTVEGEPRQGSLLDFEMKPELENSSTNRVRLKLCGEDLEVVVDYTPTGSRLFELVDETASPVTVGSPAGARPLVQYLNAEPPTVFFADGSSMVRNILTSPASEGFLAFEPGSVEVVDWEARNVDVHSESSTNVAGKVSVQEYLQTRLVDSTADIVFFDDGTGEAADYICLERRTDEIEVALYHCKASGGPAGGDRVNDVYEVCGQAIKCVLIALHRRRLHDHLKRRPTRPGPRPSKFLKGTLQDFEALLEEMRTTRTVTKVIVVQPGITRSSLSAKIASVLGAAGDSLRKAGCDFTVLGAA